VGPAVKESPSGARARGCARHVSGPRFARASARAGGGGLGMRHPTWTPRKENHGKLPFLGVNSG
jgi:hypothetical protein